MIGRFYKLPFSFVEPEGEAAAMIRDAHGQSVAMLMWPMHPPENTDAAVQETYAIARAFIASTRPAESALADELAAAILLSKLRDEGQIALTQADANRILAALRQPQPRADDAGIYSADVGAPAMTRNSAGIGRGEVVWKGGFDQASWKGRYAEALMCAGAKPYEAECWALNAWEASPDDADPDDTASDDMAYAREDGE